MRIYTRVTAPFRLGGTDAFMATDAAPLSVHCVLGVELAVFQNPTTGTYHVAEATSGGFVGYGPTEADALREVVNDIASAPADMIAQQITDGVKWALHADDVSPDYFWSRFRR